MIETELPWSRWIQWLVISLELEELDQYRWWVSAQQDPKKFKWATKKARPLTPEELGDKVLRFAAAQSRGKIPAKGDVATVAEARGWGVVYQVTLPDGRIRYQDKQGHEIKVEGTFVPSKKLSSSDERIYVREG